MMGLTEENLYRLHNLKGKRGVQLSQLGKSAYNQVESCPAGALAPGPGTQLLITVAIREGSRGINILASLFYSSPDILQCPPLPEPCGKLECK